ncbi:Uncharacterised protein [Vibrio cholerae]|nr:Uncharacterised protein [Vibrio cholerae]CSC92041.1 Uncharacterised protein [Vibrio cholerae]CSI53263.1 Uncharacterised protein [Vibrio cholerae]
MITDEVRIVVIQKGKGTIIKGFPENRHIIGIHHPVVKAVRLPLRNHQCSALNHLRKPSRIRFRCLHAIWEMPFDDFIRQ